jgi:hypothetical protein
MTLGVSDYEECADCGYDHEYEPEAAQAWHKANGAPGVGILPEDDLFTIDAKLRGKYA